MGETLLAGREQECTRNRARAVRSCSRALAACLNPDRLEQGLAKALGLSGDSPPSYRLGRGALSSLVEEVADDQEDDRPDHDSPSRAALSDHADERQDDDHDASQDCDDPNVLHGDPPRAQPSSELRAAPSASCLG